jgi:hypothetical protein
MRRIDVSTRIRMRDTVGPPKRATRGVGYRELLGEMMSTITNRFVTILLLTCVGVGGSGCWRWRHHDGPPPRREEIRHEEHHEEVHHEEHHEEPHEEHR